MLLQQQQEAGTDRSPSQASGQSSVGTGLGGITGGFLSGNTMSGSGRSATTNFYDARFDGTYDAISPTTLDKPAPTHNHNHNHNLGPDHDRMGAGLGHGHVHRNSDGGQNGTQNRNTRHAFDRYAARVQTDTDMPIGTEAMLNASADMGIEAMLRWPVFKRKLDALKIPSHVSVVSLMETPASGTDTDTMDGMPLKQLDAFDQPDVVDRTRILELVDNFLVNNNLKNPILGPAGLRADAEIFAASPLAWTGRNCLMVGVVARTCRPSSTPLGR